MTLRPGGVRGDGAVCFLSSLIEMVKAVCGGLEVNSCDSSSCCAHFVSLGAGVSREALYMENRMDGIREAWLYIYIYAQGDREGVFRFCLKMSGLSGKRRNL